MQLGELLTQNWWQGIAGITQILASILALITILQAMKTIRQADQARRESVAPEWDILSESVQTFLHIQVDKYYYIDGNLELKNTGNGSARNIKINFKSINGNNPSSIDITGLEKATKSVPPEGVLNVKIRWDIDTPPEGILKITSISRLGDTNQKSFYIQGFIVCGISCGGNLSNWNIAFIQKEDSFITRIIKKLTKVFYDDENPQDSVTTGSGERFYAVECWVRDNFPIEQDGQGGMVITQKNQDGSTNGISVRNLVSMIGTVSLPPTLNELKTIVPESSGWHRIFENWEHKGIIKHN